MSDDAPDAADQPPDAAGPKQPTASGKPREEAGKPREEAGKPREESSGGAAGPERGAARPERSAARPGPDVEERLANTFTTFNVFNGSVEAPHSAFGTGVNSAQDGSARRARTGKLSDEEVSDLCDYFAEPPLFRAAAEALKRDQVVVLTGADGQGKAAGAVALLREAGAGPLAILSPTITLKELAREEFEVGHGYLVEGWQDTRGEADSGDFPWRLLRDHAKDSKIHLVVTATAARTDRSVTQFAWLAPSATQVLTAYLAGTDAEAVVVEIAAVVPATYGLGSVAAIARRLASGEDQATILEELSQDPARHVGQWFSAEERTDEEIGEATALCFAVGQSERIYEVMLKRLEHALRKVGLLPDPEKDGKDNDGAARDNVPRPGLRRVRARRVRPDGLLERTRVTAGGAGREIVAFKVDKYHQHALEELWRGFDMTFWLAVRDWLAELISDTAVIHDAAVQVSVAAGLASLARVALDEVEESYLDPWAAGELGWSGQQTAVYVLWWMSTRDSPLAPIALHIATKWVNSGDAACQWTAATALSGGLGVGYPVEAARRVFHLVGQSDEVRPAAIFALANLFATLTREGDGQDAAEVLKLLRERMTPGTRRDGGGNGWSAQSRRDDQRNQERARLSILAVLAIRDPVMRQPSVTLFLNAHPEHRGLVAELWAEVLGNRMYRHRALVSLLAVVRGFGEVSDDPEQAAHALGDALSAALPVVEHQPLKTDFINLHTHSKQRRSDIAATVRALLDALEHLKPTESETG